MLNKILQKLRNFWQFFLEKPSARGNWQWVVNPSNYSNLEIDPTEDIYQSPEIYLPSQINYFDKTSKLANSPDKRTETLHYLSNCLAKTYYPPTQSVGTPKKEDRRQS